MNTIKYAGYLLVGTGVIHSLIGLLAGWPILTDMHNAGWLNSTVEQGAMVFERSAILWFLLSGCFWLVFGLTLQKAIDQGFVPPLSLGWGFMVIGVVTVIIIPVSGAYLFIIQGALLAYGCSTMKNDALTTSNASN